MLFTASLVFTRPDVPSETGPINGELTVFSMFVPSQELTRSGNAASVSGVRKLACRQANGLEKPVRSWAWT